MLYLVDTSIWIAHLRSPRKDLIRLLQRRQVLIHGCVIGELACGSLLNRQHFLNDLFQLPRVTEASFQECLGFVEQYQLFNKGLGWIDVQLLASASLSDAKVLSLDKALIRYTESSI